MSETEEKKLSLKSLEADLKHAQKSLGGVVNQVNTNAKKQEEDHQCVFDHINVLHEQSNEHDERIKEVDEAVLAAGKIIKENQDRLKALEKNVQALEKIMEEFVNKLRETSEQLERNVEATKTEESMKVKGAGKDVFRTR